LARKVSAKAGGGVGGGSKVALKLGIFGEVDAECGGGGVGGVGSGLIKAEILTKGGSVVSKGASSTELAGGAEGIEKMSVG
jgi:hypothetical protein